MLKDIFFTEKTRFCYIAATVDTQIEGEKIMPNHKLKASAIALIEMRQRQDQQTREATKAYDFKILCSTIQHHSGRLNVPTSAIEFIWSMGAMINYGNENYQPAVEWLGHNAHIVYNIRHGSYTWVSAEDSERAANWMNTHPDDFVELIRANQFCAIL